MHIHNKLYGHIYNICIYTDIYMDTIYKLYRYIYINIYTERESL